METKSSIIFDNQYVLSRIEEKYRFTNIIDLDNIPFFRSNKKYFRYIDYYTAGQSENDEDVDTDMIMAYNVFEV